jgi:TorA maturation chaperone TorD
MHYLAFKEAAALAHNDPVADVRLAQRDFLGRHLCRWLPRVRARLQSGSDVPQFYVYALDLTTTFCQSDLDWLKAA